jgi:acyl-coenzyme A synthetase/AMP-(fatty) acid ligase
MFKKKLVQRLYEFGHKKAVIYSDKEYKYEELVVEIAWWQNLIKEKNILSGQIVSLVCDYSFKSIAALLALYENSNVIVPITTKIEIETNERIEVSQTDVIIEISNVNIEIKFHENFDNKHALIQDISNKNAAGLILFSSGSTGKPKAMVHNLDNLAESYLDRKSKNINFLVFLMFDHIGGINTLLNCLAMGATITIPNSRNPEEVCSLIQKYKVQVLPSSPTFLNLILIGSCHTKYDLSSLIMITYGTEPMPESLLGRLKETFPRVKFLQTFGTSETGIIKTSSKSNSSTFLKIEDDKQEFQIVDGELWIRSKTQILGYLNHNSDSFTTDGWFKTGDIVKLQEDGYLNIIGRKKEIINVGGEKVLPQEVENILMELDYVQDATVYAMPSPIVGEAVAVDIVFKENVSLPENIKSQVRNHCKSKLEAYKVPVKINVVENLVHSERFKKLRKK